MKHKLIALLVAVMALGVTLTAYFRFTAAPSAPEIASVVITRGDLHQTVQATGTLQAVSTVEVGSQVSGRIAELHADYNSVVHKGEVIARLDPSLFQAQVEQARATLARVEAQEAGAAVQEKDAASKLARARQLAADTLVSAQDLDTAQTTYDAAVASVKSARADAIQARAALNQAEVNLQHTVIEAPTDGVVISRAVEVGQTVAAAMQAPTLFTIAGDLSQMQVNASIDEADIGTIRPGQPVTFKVDAYADRQFRGRVTQVRLQPTVVQNVTTYTTVIEVPNRDLLLKPGMTANVTVNVAERTDVLRVSNAALRFHPAADTFAALGQEPPAAVGGSRETSHRRTADAQPAVADEPAADWKQARTIDAAFGPLPVPDRPARLWQYRDGQLVAVPVRVGLTDGTTTEILSGPLEPGSTVVTGVTVATTTASASAQGRSPLLPQFPRGAGGRNANASRSNGGQR